MGSHEWMEWRRRWHAQWVAHYGCEPVCAVCAKAWTLTNGDLHHRSYDRLGAEGWADVSPLCRRCHDCLHIVYESNPLWRRLGRARATDLIIAELRRLTSRPARPRSR